MMVRVEYKNRRLETVGCEEYDFDVYCQKLSQELTWLLTDIEMTFKEQYEKHGIECEDYFKSVRHKVLDVAGAIKRLPQNVVQEEPIEYIEPEIIEPQKKATLSTILSLFGKNESKG